MCLDPHKQNRATVTSLSLKSKVKLIRKMAFFSYNDLIPRIRIISQCLNFYIFEEWKPVGITDLRTLELLSTCWKTVHSKLCKWSTSIYWFPSTPGVGLPYRAFPEGLEERNKDTKTIWLCLLLACYFTDRIAASSWVRILHTLKPVCKHIHMGSGLNAHKLSAEEIRAQKCPCQTVKGQKSILT